MRKLTDEAVEDIRQSDEPAKVLAWKYGVTPASIYNVINGHFHGDGTARRSSKLGRPRKPELDPKPCACGCGELTRRGKSYVQYHYAASAEGRAKGRLGGQHKQARSDEQWLADTLSNCQEEDRGYTSLCRIWQGALNGTNGYPITTVNGATTTRQRHVYCLVNGVTLPRNVVVKLLCEQPGCLEPTHLRATTCADTVRRSQKATPMTPDAVEELRFLRDNGWTYADLGVRYGLRPESVSQIFTGRRWA
jgi:hypothetical protein